MQTKFEKKYTLELGCAPGRTRPGDLLPIVLKDTGINPKEIGNPSTSFGDWTWTIPEELHEKYVKARLVIKKRIIKMHKSGFIRYGSW